MSDHNSHPVRLVIIDEDVKMRDSLKDSLSSYNIRVVGESDNLKSGMRVLRGVEPNVALIQMSQDSNSTFEAVRRLVEELPATAVILTTTEMSAELVLTGVRSGAKEFLSRPIDPVELQRALDQIERSRAKPLQSSRRRGRILSVFGAKGGIGTTTVAVNLAVAMSQQGQRTVLVDMQSQLGDAALQLDCKPRYSLWDAVREGDFDETRLQSVMAQHSSELFVLNVANRPEDADHLTTKHISEMMGLLKTMFDNVVLDLGRHLEDRNVEAADLSDRILVVTELSLSAVRNCAQYIELFRRLEVETDKTRVVVNRFHRRYWLSVSDVEKTLGRTIFWKIPNDYNPMSHAAANGVPAVLSAPKSRVAKNLQELNESLRPNTEASEDSDVFDFVNTGS